MTPEIVFPSNGYDTSFFLKSPVKENIKKTRPHHTNI